MVFFVSSEWNSVAHMTIIEEDGSRTFQILSGSISDGWHDKS